MIFNNTHSLISFLSMMFTLKYTSYIEEKDKLKFLLVFMFYVFQRLCILPFLSKSKMHSALFRSHKCALPFFRSQKCTLPFFQKWKINPAPFPTISMVRKPVPAENHKILLEKYVCVRENFSSQKQQILRQNPTLFLHGETFNKKGE